MAALAHVPVVASRNTAALDCPRHAALVRVTHWITTVSFVALLVSGVAILLAQPGLYWGETGIYGDPSLINLHLTQNEHHSGWGRSLHFLAAWVCVLTGLLYAVSGLLTRHFRDNLVPGRAELAWRPIRRVLWNHLRLKRPGEDESRRYNVVQCLIYLAVVFVLFPLMIQTGLAMSPAVVSVLPATVSIWGGHQSARTIHFFVMNLLILFLIIHVAMVCLAGFRTRTWAMITGRGTAGKEHL